MIGFLAKAVSILNSILSFHPSVEITDADGDMTVWDSMVLMVLIWLW